MTFDEWRAELVRELESIGVAADRPAWNTQHVPRDPMRRKRTHAESGMGRKPKRSQPTDVQREQLLELWLNPKAVKRHVVLSFAEGMLKRKVKEWELKHWLGDSRTPKADD